MSWLSRIFKHRIKRKREMKPMLNIKRVVSDDESTQGMLYIPGYACYTLERPWVNNKPFISCIPEGIYEAEKFQSPTRNKMLDGWVVLLRDVSDRTWIEIHTANKVDELSGCIAVGQFKDGTDNMPGVFESTEAMREIIALLPDKFQVRIENVFKVRKRT